jgi:hypothetical protein
LIAGCASEPETFTDPEPTFASIRANVLQPRCGVICHSSVDPAGRMDLEDDPYHVLVGVDADGIQCGGLDWKRVVPGDPDHSLLFQKLKAKHDGVDAPCGDAMPQGPRTPLDDVALDAVRTWILEGAEDN